MLILADHKLLISALPAYLIFFSNLQILPTAQRLLDELLSSQSTAINTVCGAPGKSANTISQLIDSEIYIFDSRPRNS